MCGKGAIAGDVAETRDMSRPERLRVHGAVSAALALHSDHSLRELVESAVPIGSGIGGKSALLTINGNWESWQLYWSRGQASQPSRSVVSRLIMK